MRVMGVYKITHTPTGRCYVGSSVHVRKRWVLHRSQLRHGRHHSPFLQRQWRESGPKAFAFEVVEAVASETELVEREKHWVATLSPAYNSMQPDDDRIFRHDEATKVKMTAAQLRIWSDRKTKGPFKQSAEWVANRQSARASQKGWACTDETRGKLSAAAKRRPPMSADQRAKIGKAVSEAAKRRKPISEETRRRLSESHVGKKLSPEHRQKIGNAQLGRTLTPETRQKISMARRAGIAKRAVAALAT